MKIADLRVQDLFDYLSSQARIAFKSEYLIANEVLCKTETSASIQELYLSGSTPEVSFFERLCQLLRYGIRGTAWLGLYGILHVVYLLSGQKQALPESKEIVLLDVYFVIRKILEEGKYSDHFFSGLEAVLRERGKTYIYSPRFFGSYRPTDLYRLFRLLKKGKTPVIVEFQGMGFADYWRALRFLVGYPWQLLGFLRQLGNSREDRLLRFALWRGLDGVALKNYMRYLFGRRLAGSAVGRLHCISWYENKSAEKNFYRGLRSVSGKSRIYGARLFLWPDTILNLYPDMKEMEFDLVPDRILENGPYYVSRQTGLDCRVGPSLRYRHIFEQVAHPADGQHILIVLPYWDMVVRRILKLIRQIPWPSPVLLKFHPSVDPELYRKEIGSSFEVSNEDLPRLLVRARCVIGQSTGTLIEAASMGIPVIVIECPEVRSYDYMPAFGKDIIWDKVVDARTLVQSLSRFELLLSQDPDRLSAAASQFKEQFFCYPNPDKIAEAFDLL